MRSAGAIFFSLTVIVFALAAAGCIPKDQTAEVKKLKERLEELESKQDIADSQDQEDKTSVFSEKIEDLTRRMGEFEEARGEMRDAILGEFTGQNEKLQRMFRGFNEMHEMIQTGQTWAALGFGFKGHAVARTRHGSFLVEMDTPEELAEGYRLTLRIGNPTGLHIHQFKVFGNYGSPPPDVSDAPDYSTMIQRIDQWEASLKDFDSSFVTSLAPRKWTRVNLVIPAERFAELQFIRFRMVIDRASLLETDIDQKTAQLGIDYKGAVVLDTPHGAFPLTIKDSREVKDGWELDILIGNPLGMTVTNARLVGVYGPKPPEYIEGEDHERFGERLVIWDASLIPYDEEVADLDSPLRSTFWNPVTIKLPVKSRAELGHIRARLEILNVSLQNTKN
ncbi:MAG: hypothetical protein ACI8UO_002290 [Verrucomicrobiales bacterium]|jgi:hypothetical protein